MAPTQTLDRPLTEVVLRDGKPYVHCTECSGSGEAQPHHGSAPFCTVCFGAGVAPVFEAARFAFARFEAEGIKAPSLDAPERSGRPGSSSGQPKPGPANKFASPCIRCGARVEAGEGFRVRDAGEWVTTHKPRQCPETTEVKMETSSTTLATEKQISFLETLVRERMPYADSLDPAGREFCRQALHTLRAIKGGATFDRQAMSQIIQETMQVKVPRTAPAQPVEDGTPESGIDLSVLPSTGERTFFGVPGADTRLKVLIERPTEGRWAGWIFVKDGAEYGHGNNYGRQAPGRTYTGDIQDELRAILADPEAALKRYAELTSRCGVCNRTLEDEVSVARGIGPQCARRLGW